MSRGLAGSRENIKNQIVYACSVRSKETEQFYPATISREQLDETSEYGDVIRKLHDLDFKDDDETFNVKVACIMYNWKKTCKTREEVEKCFKRVYEACLKDEELASKLVYMTASKTSISQDVLDTNIRFLMVLQIQVSFDERLSMLIKNPTAFRNSVRMLGEFYYKALHAIDGKILEFLMKPLVCYLKLLLVAGTSRDLQLFRTQIFLNGSSIKSAYPEELIELLREARKKILYHPTLSEECKIFLLQALNLYIQTFTLLPGENPSLKTLEYYELSSEQHKKDTTATSTRTATTTATATATATPYCPIVYYPNNSRNYYS